MLHCSINRALKFGELTFDQGVKGEFGPLGTSEEWRSSNLLKREPNAEDTDDLKRRAAPERSGLSAGRRHAAISHNPRCEQAFSA